MNWKSYTIDLGTIKQNSRHTLVYESTKPLDIYKISPGCTQCTKIDGYSDTCAKRNGRKTLSVVPSGTSPLASLSR